VTTAIILAGGMGTRLREIVPNVPKPMAPISGRPFLEYLMDYWIVQGVKQFVISIGYKKEVIVDHFGSCYNNTPLIYIAEEEPLGTGGALLLAAQGLSKPFLVINGDTYFEANLPKLVEFHTEHSSEWTFSLFQINGADRYMEINLNANGEFESVNKTKSRSSYLVNGGVYYINPSVISKTKITLGHKLSLENDLTANFVAQGGKLYGLEFDGKFIDIGVPDDYFRAVEILANKKIKS
jgi:D-glycero-alpha-D-manno-heptose 1-phosphate guanylyltransferase